MTLLLVPRIRVFNRPLTTLMVGRTRKATKQGSSTLALLVAETYSRRLVQGVALPLCPSGSRVPALLGDQQLDLVPLGLQLAKVQPRQHNASAEMPHPLVQTSSESI